MWRDKTWPVVVPDVLRCKPPFLQSTRWPPVIHTVPVKALVGHWTGNTSFEGEILGSTVPLWCVEFCDSSLLSWSAVSFVCEEAVRQVLF